MKVAVALVLLFLILPLEVRSGAVPIENFVVCCESLKVHTVEVGKITLKAGEEPLVEPPPTTWCWPWKPKVVGDVSMIESAPGLAVASLALAPVTLTVRRVEVTWANVIVKLAMVPSDMLSAGKSWAMPSWQTSMVVVVPVPVQANPVRTGNWPVPATAL